MSERRRPRAAGAGPDSEFGTRGETRQEPPCTSSSRHQRWRSSRTNSDRTPRKNSSYSKYPANNRVWSSSASSTAGEEAAGMMRPRWLRPGSGRRGHAALPHCGGIAAAAPGTPEGPPSRSTSWPAPPPRRRPGVAMEDAGSDDSDGAVQGTAPGRLGEARQA